MPKLAANLTMLFTERPFMDRFAAAAQAGFDAVEFLFPYAWPAQDLRAELDRHGLQLVLHNLPAGHWEAGERGIACHPDRVAEFRAGVEQALAYARVLGVRQLNCLIGKLPETGETPEVRATVIDNLRHAAAVLESAGLQLLIEPINTYDIPGFYLHHSAQALALMDAVGADNLRLQYDIYHMQRMEGEIAGNLRKLLPRIGHVQLADNPGRHEPGTGELNYPFLLQQLDAMGYAGWVGCEYQPQTQTEAGLGWMHTLKETA